MLVYTLELMIVHIHHVRKVCSVSEVFIRFGGTWTPRPFGHWFRNVLSSIYCDTLCPIRYLRPPISTVFTGFL